MLSIDIILVTYNQERYIQQAMHGVNIQRICENMSVRVIVADDCSSDKTLSIIKSAELVSPFEFVYLDGNTNVGMHRNYERAFKACTADYVAVLEGDDYWVSPNHLMQHIDFLEKHKECSMSMNNIVLLNDSTTEKRLNRIFETDYQYVDIIGQIEEGNQLGNLSACVCRGDYIKNLPQAIYDMGFADWFLGMWMAQYGLIGLLKEVTSVYRLNPNGLWTKLGDKEKKQELLSMIATYDEMLSYQYHDSFMVYKKKLQCDPPTQRKWKSFVPPILVAIVKLFMPPIMYQFLIKKG